MIAEQYTKSIKDYIEVLEQQKEAYITSMKIVYANEHGIPTGTKVQIKKGLEEKYFSLKGIVGVVVDSNTFNNALYIPYIYCFVNFEGVENWFSIDDLEIVTEE